jgi:hypothetical protein
MKGLIIKDPWITSSPDPMGVNALIHLYTVTSDTPYSLLSSFTGLPE